MSISNRHSVVGFVAGKSEAMAEQRLAKVGYKSTKATPAKFKSVCASVPFIPSEVIAENVERLIPFIRTMVLESAQDGIFRSLYESSQGSLQAITDDDLSIDSCIAYLTAENAGSRLTSAMLEAWYDSEMKDGLIVALGIKAGFISASSEGEVDVSEAQLAQLEKMSNGYRGLISSLAGGKTMLSPEKCKGVLKAIDAAGLDSDNTIAGRLIVRVKNMLAEHEKVAKGLEFEMIL